MQRRGSKSKSLADPVPAGPPAIAQVKDAPEEPEPPSCCWSRRLDTKPPSASVHKMAKPGFVEIIGLLPIAARVGSYIQAERKVGRQPIFDLSGIDLHPPDPGPVAGVPLGGLGGGGIGRGWRGDFNRWSLWPGRYKFGSVLADQFAIRAVPSGLPNEEAQAVALSCPTSAQKAALKRSAMKSWNFGLDPAKATYYGLFPRAWTTYEEPLPGLRVSCKQVSPVVPHDYATASLPAAVFVWTVENVSDQPLDVSMMFTFQNGDGGPGDSSGGHRNSAFTTAPESNQAVTGAGAAAAEEKKEGAPAEEAKVVGVALAHMHRQRRVFNPKNEKHSAPPVSRANKSTTNPVVSGGGSAAAADDAVMGKEFLDVATFGVSALDNASVKVSTLETFDTSLCSDKGRRGAALWEAFKQKGSVVAAAKHGTSDAEAAAAATGSAATTSEEGSVKGATLGAAVCQELKEPLLPGEARQFTFALTWDIPLARFGSGRALPRRYTKYFGRGGTATPQLAAHALNQWRRWERGIEAWQQPVLKEANLTPVYKCLLFNELYFLVDGGTIWTDSTRGEPNAITAQHQDHPSKTFTFPHEALVVPYSTGQGGGKIATSSGGSGSGSAKAASGPGTTCGTQSEVGQFLYLEGHEYLMYNTYDVHFYASFALTSLWPQLQLSLQRDFATAVHDDDAATTRKLIGNGRIASRKVQGAVPHDLGSPCEEPWTKVNVYNFQDVSSWKDLGPKFVLTVLRDFTATKSVEFVRDVFPTVATVMHRVSAYDRDGDGLIENDGFPDQTYDIWTVTGPSAYTAGLWVAALAACVQLGEVLLEAGNFPQEGPDANSRKVGPSGGQAVATEALVTATIARYKPLYIKAKKAYEAKLWNGKYFNYDSSGSYQSNSIMSDQCAGQWYASACDLPAIVDRHKCRSSLRTVFEFNVQGFGKGRRGAVNGMRPDTKKADQSSMQSREVWTGTTYAVAAAMLQEYGAEQAERSRTATSSSAAAAASGVAAEDEHAAGPGSSGGGGGGTASRVNLWDAAFQTINGLWLSGWNELGYWYATPEAWELKGNYRSLGYMRPLSVWALQWAIEKGNLLEARAAEQHTK